MMAPVVLRTRILWLPFHCQGQRHGPCSTLSHTSILTPTLLNPLHTTSSPTTATAQAVQAASTVKATKPSFEHCMGESFCIWNVFVTVIIIKLCFCISFSGSHSSGSTRSDGDRRRGSKSVAGSTADGSTRDDKSPGGGGADSRSGSGSESDYSVRSSLRRDRGSATPSEHSRSSQRSHHRPPPTHLAPYPAGIPIPYNPMMVMMVPQHPHPHLALGSPLPQTPTLPHHPVLPSSITPGGPPGAPPTRDLGSVPPELTASRQSFHLAMGNPSEFFVDVM